MLPKSVSASAFEAFECPARYKATSLEKVPEMSAAPASKGSVWHNVLERWVLEGHHTPQAEFSVMEQIAEEEYYKIFPEPNYLDEIMKVLKKWYGEHGDDYWEGREVFCAEVKETFPMETSQGVIPVTYIMDRCDILERDDDGNATEIEVVDYKSFINPVKEEDLKHKIQPRLYAVAAQLKFPHAKIIWVTFDLLRYGEVTVRFRIGENRKSYIHIKKLIEKILASDGTEEVLNHGCRWCVRMNECGHYQEHAEAGGPLGYTTIEDLLNRWAELKWMADAIKTQETEFKDAVFELAERQDITLEGFSTDTVRINLGGRTNRKIDPHRLRKIIGDDLYADIAKPPPLKAIDDMIKDGTLTDDQAGAIKGITTKVPSAPWLKATKVTKEGTGAEED